MIAKKTFALNSPSYSVKGLFVFLSLLPCVRQCIASLFQEQTRREYLSFHVSREAVIYPILTSQTSRVSLMGYSLAVCRVALQQIFFRLQDQAKQI